MKIHEYQAKRLLRKMNLPIQDGYVAESEEDISDTVERVEKDFRTKQFVVKAQIHAGGRGLGGGVKFSLNKEDAIENAKNILGMNLVTHQTGKSGQLVRKVMITEAVDIAKEYYVALTVDRTVAQHVFMVSTEGGVDIEEVANETPEKIIKLYVPPAFGLQPFQARKLSYALGFKDDVFKQGIKLFQSLYQMYLDLDAEIIEINPLVLTKQNNILALDAKFNFDSNALFRHPDIQKLQDVYEEDPTELEASKSGLNYIKLDGNVGCMVNGAGLAMATMDIIKLKGGKPANFLDVGGGANVDAVKEGFKIILSDSNVKTVLINIFGGIVRCDRVANGIIAAVKELELTVPIIVRLEGTNSEIARELLKNSNVSVTPATSLADAADKAIASVQK